MSTGDWILQFTTVIALVVAYFSALLLNYCDFSRFAPEEDTVKKGTLLGLPVNFAVFAFITVLVTAGSIAVFGEAIRDPVEIVARIDNTAVVIVGAIIFTVATVGINLVANYVSPAYDLANVAPKYIDFKRGGLITSVLAVVVLPWHIYGSAWAVNYFLGGLGAILGPLFAIMMVDFFRVRRRKVNVDDLYVDGPAASTGTRAAGTSGRSRRSCRRRSSASPCALLTPLHDAAAFSWFIGAGIAALVYALITRTPTPERAPAAAAASAAARSRAIRPRAEISPVTSRWSSMTWRACSLSPAAIAAKIRRCVASERGGWSGRDSDAVAIAPRRRRARAAAARAPGCGRRRGSRRESAGRPPSPIAPPPISTAICSFAAASSARSPSLRRSAASQAAWLSSASRSSLIAGIVGSARTDGSAIGGTRSPIAAHEVDADAVADVDEPDDAQDGERLAQRGAADVEVAGELALRRQAVARLQLARCR